MKHEPDGLAALLAPFLAQVGAPEAFVALAELCPDAAVFAVDADRNVVFWSDGAERVLGFRAAEMVGAHCLKGNRCPQCIRGCGIAEHGVIQGAPLALYRADGSLVHVRKFARSFIGPDGSFQGGVEVLMPSPAQPSAGRAGLPILGESSAEVEDFHGIVSRDPAMRQLFIVVRNVGRTDVTALVRGESGAGKELFARAIHEESHRKGEAFLAVNCAAMSPALLESELFGHERGAFTGAVQKHQGVFERADGGTLFLDEVAELPLELQAKLLRVLEDRTFFRVGGSKPIKVDVRIISATHRSLKAEVAAGRFREDLMYRLRVVPLFVPPLRERKVDLPLLVERFLRDLSARGPRRVTSVAPDAMRAILDYDWPGNVRELRNAIEYAVAVHDAPVLALEALPLELRTPVGAPRRPAPGQQMSGRQRAGDDERAVLERALALAGGNVGKAAALLGVSRPTFWRRRKRAQLDE